MASTRTTIMDLHNIATRINRLTKSPENQFAKNADGKTKFSVGNFHIDCAYGGYRMERVESENGAISDVCNQGYMPASALKSCMLAFIAALYFAEQNAKATQTGE